MGLFSKKVALVTGATSGIGRATALAFAREGATVIVSGRREAQGLETTRRLQETGAETFFQQADITSEPDVEELFTTIQRRFGRLDLAFNNAGVLQTPTPFVQDSARAYAEIMDVNVKGVWLALRAEVALMASTGGAIVNNSSIAGLVGFPGMALYVASKHAVVGLTKAIALEYARMGIRVNAVCPGVVATERFWEMVRDVPHLHRQMSELHPCGRIAECDDIARAVVWLCSPAAGFVTGHCLTVDGGYVVA